MSHILQLDPDKSYRFAVPCMRLSGTGNLYWGAQRGAVCDLNTTARNDNPYFAILTPPLFNRWYLLLGHVYPRNATGLTSTGSGAYDLSNGALLVPGTSFNFRPDLGGVLSTRAYQYYSAAGSQALFGHPVVELLDGSEQSMAQLLQSSAILNSQQQWLDVNNRPKSFRAVSQGLSASTSPHIPGLFNGETDATITSSVARSYMFNTIRRSDGFVNPTQFFDVYGSTANATAMANALNLLDSSVIVVVRTYDEPANNRLFGTLPAAMYRCGASQAVYASNSFRSRAAYVMVGIPGCGEGNGAEFYQGTVDNDTNAWVDVTFFLQNGNLVGTSPSFTPRTLRDYNFTGDYGATKDILLVNFANTEVLGNTVRKVSDGGVWTGSAYSLDSFTGGAYATASPGTTDVGGMMFGLNGDPLTDANYPSLDYAIYFVSDGRIQVYESGNFRGDFFSSYATTDVYAITYDGANIRYMKNGTVFYTSLSLPGAGRVFFWDSSIYRIGDFMNNCRFGPMSPVTAISTGQLQPGSATSIYSAAHVATALYSSSA